jgi:hypothetical protein
MEDEKLSEENQEPSNIQYQRAIKFFKQNWKTSIFSHLNSVSSYRFLHWICFIFNLQKKK